MGVGEVWMSLSTWASNRAQKSATTVTTLGVLLEMSDYKLLCTRYRLNSIFSKGFFPLPLYTLALQYTPHRPARPEGFH